MKTISTMFVRAGLLATLTLLMAGTARSAISVDATAFGNQGTARTTVATSSFSTTAANELLLAFVSADQVSSSATTVTGITGGGLTWVLVKRTNTQLGTAEIWRAFATSTLTGATVTATLSQSVCSSITVMSFAGVDTSGTNGSGAIGAVGTGNANPGSPTASLVTTRNGSLVVGVGNDWDNAIGRTVGAGQTLVHQYFPPVGDTYWVQMETSATPLSGTTVTINDTAPSGDRYNLSTAEILAAGGGTGSNFAVSGTISPTTAGTGTTVTLSQGTTTIATTSATGSGTYSFSNIANGTYTVTPSNSAFTFSPASQSVTVNGANATVPVFSATAVSFTVSGTISPTTAGTGTTVTLSQGTTTIATTSATGSGTYSFSNIANGTYTVTPSNSAFTFSPASQSVTVSGANATVPVFNASAVSFTVSGTISPTTAGTGTTVTLSQGTTTIATTSATGSGTYSFSNIANGTYTVTPSNSSFSFSPTSQSVTVSGANATVPVFNASAVSFTVSGTISPTTAGAGTTVTLSQGTTTIATTSATGSGTYSFSNIANGTYTVTPSNSAFTFSPASQSVTVNGANATVPVFNASAVSFTVSGTISPTTAGTGTTVTLSQGTTTIATTSATGSGTYSFSNIANGTYTVTPSNSSFSFSPTSQSVTVNGANATVPVFNATAVGFTVSGTISPTSAGPGTTLTLSQGGTTVATVSAMSDGTYSFTNVANGTYTVTPTNSGFSFNPINQPVTVNGGSATVPVFNATAGSTWNISGTITPAASAAQAVVTLSQNGNTVATATVDSSGNYSFLNMPNGVYTATPGKANCSFSPANQTITVNGANVVVGNITATTYTGTLEYPNLSDIIPTGAISVVGTGSSTEFQYTHDTYNGGPGPLVIQPVYNPASGTYQGTQYIYSLSSTGTWTLVQRVRIAGAFGFDAAHGHFHYPFTTYGLYNVGPNGGPGTPVAISGKISFCIADSFIYNSSLPNAGALGNLGSCSDPTSLRGLDIGAVDEYDQTDEGQSISIAGVPNGTYWLRASVDPDDYLAESDKTNNETDVEVAINGNTVQVLQTVIPVSPNPPNISVNAPADGSTVTGTVQLTASTATTSGVQFLIDGSPLGNAISSAPYTMSWDTTTATNGSHWLAAQTTGPTGIIGTSAVVAVTVSNISTMPPTVQLTAPTAGETVSATVTVAANAASGVGIASVSFYVDGAAIGTPLTAPPYLTTWDTETATAGQHSLTATAIDTTGNSSTSAPVTVTVDNSHPPNVIGMDASVSVDGAGSMTSPAITTSQNGELIMAFVSYDGPSNASQTATVTGPGLLWTLVKRSNHQSGTAEIWMAHASDSPQVVTATAQPGVGTNYHGSLTVIAFANASGPGIVNQTSAPTGAPDVYLPGISAGNWVFAVGNDWDNAIARTLVSGQVLVHQKVDTVVGDTYWVQSTAAPSTANALVDIHDSAPTTDQWNYAAVEIVATRQ